MDTHPFRRILVGWDASYGAQQALTTAISLAPPGSGHVVALAVTDRMAHLETEQQENDASRSDTAHLVPEFSRCCQEANGHGVQVELAVVHQANIPDALRAYALESGFSLIAVGRHGRGGIRHQRLGHVANDLVRHDGIPVLVVTGAGEGS